MSIYVETTKTGRRIIKIWAHGKPECACSLLSSLIRDGMIKPDEYRTANFCWNGKETENPKALRNYALKFYTQYRKEEIRISGVGCGVRDFRAEATVQCLEMMGFEINSNDDVYDLPFGERRNFAKKLSKK